MGAFRCNTATDTDIELEHLDEPKYKVIFSGVLPDWLTATLKQGEEFSGVFSFSKVGVDLGSVMDPSPPTLSIAPEKL